MERGGLRVALLLFLLGNISGRRRDYSLFSKNFLSVNLNENQHRELRISYKRILILETTAFMDTPDVLIVRRITDGRRLVQLVFQHGGLRDCEYTENRKMVLRLLSDFTQAKKILSRSSLTNVMQVYPNTSALQSGGAVHRVHTPDQLGRFRGYTDIHSQAKTCHQLVSNMKRQAMREAVHNRRKDKFANSSKFGARKNVTSHLHVRSKRDLFSGWLIFPGTKWCGDGDVADSYDDLGYDRKTDACCRKHDSCPHIIERFSYKYNYFNYKFHTLSHCNCDNRFRRCLKRSKSSTAKLVGQLFFNILNPQCFKFTKKRACLTRTWLGTCHKYGKGKSALPRDSMGF
ncbi:uncharacterized protein LOC124126741 [Haliotis rufescens]|uniref:uncharacterized protein LOC124126741 n=1 Tax=Haliotis rufescens TaxID=6454 RepID=UPI001EAFAA29|nr:uncharacterized protein LOC124126741 [Haliotis rufescens]